MDLRSSALGVFFALALLSSFSCKWTRRADLIVHGGIIYTVDNGFSVVEAMAIRDGRILSVGSNEDILGEFESKNIIDLRGRTVFPGFIDAHCHFFGYGADLVKCNLYGTASFDEAIDRLKEYSPTNKFSWLLARGWDQNDWKLKEFPVKDRLDSLFPDIPVYMLRIDGHAVLCNSAALKLAGITANTKISGGEVLLKDGVPTGMLIDNALELVASKIPPFTTEIYNSALLQAEKNCFEVGLTTVDDAGLGKDSIQIIHDLQKAGKLKIRVYAMISDEEKTLKHFLRQGPFKTDRLNVRAIKMYADGALGSRGACLKKPYADQKDHYGFLLHPPDYFTEICDEALENGFQVCTHAIGDSACEVILKIYGDHLNGENNHRWRIEHCQVVEDKDKKMFGDYSIIPSVQPTHATSDMYWASDRLGDKRMKNAYAYKDLRDEAGGIISFGTDFPVESINPIYTFYAATERKDLKGYPSGGFQPENKTKKKDAIRAMTIWAAYSNFEEEEKGSLEEGKFADFVILDKDILNVESDEIPATKVIATYVNGERVFGNN